MWRVLSHKPLASSEAERATAQAWGACALEALRLFMANSAYPWRVFVWWSGWDEARSVGQNICLISATTATKMRKVRVGEEGTAYCHSDPSTQSQLIFVPRVKEAKKPVRPTSPW